MFDLWGMCSPSGGTTGRLWGSSRGRCTGHPHWHPLSTPPPPSPCHVTGCRLCWPWATRWSRWGQWGGRWGAQGTSRWPSPRWGCSPSPRHSSLGTALGEHEAHLGCFCLFMYHLGNNWQWLHLENNLVSPPGEAECLHLGINWVSPFGYRQWWLLVIGYTRIYFFFFLPGELTMFRQTWGTTDNSICQLNNLLFLTIYSHLVVTSQTVVIYWQCPVLTQYPSTTQSNNISGSFYINNQHCIVPERAKYISLQN